MWVAEVVDVVLDHRLDRYGIEPRDVDGLDGVLVAPFLHVGFGHLLANTIPFVVMGVVIALDGPAGWFGVTVIVALVSGLGTWLVAPEDRPRRRQRRGVRLRDLPDRPRLVQPRAREIAIGAAVAVIWGGALLGGLEPQRGISWEGHLFGAIGGVVAAAVFQRPRRQSAA